MNQHIILGIGSGRCGTLSLAQVLNRQPGLQVSHEEQPRLPWKKLPGERVIRERFARMRRDREGRVLGDVASFYLPYVEDAIAAEPAIRIVGLKRPREEVVKSFCRWLDRVHALPTNHWAERPAPGWYHEPNWTRIFPQYDIEDREEGIRRYWNEYYERVDELVRLYPENIRLYGTDQALNTEDGLRDLLSFVGIPREEQAMALGVKVHETRSTSGDGVGDTCRPREARHGGIR